MNKQSVLSTPDENKIEELLTKIQPVLSEQFHQKMKRATWRVEGGQPIVVKHFRLKMAFAIITVAVLAVVFVTPQGRAWAQEVVQFFRRVSSTSIRLSPQEQRDLTYIPGEPYELPLVKTLTPVLSPEMAGLPECQNVQDVQSYSCQIAYAELQLGFDLKEFPIQPEGWEVDFINIDSVAKTATLSYKMDFGYRNYSNLRLVQSLGNHLDWFTNRPWGRVPTDKVELVKVGTYDGEYVRGGFQLSTDVKTMTWIDSDPMQRLAWSDGRMWYLIEFFPNSNLPNSISRDQLIKMAASLVDKPTKTEKILNPEFLSSISDAEKLSGLDLKAPTLLPLGVDFSSARYISANHEVLLRYGINDEMVIHEWRGKLMNFDALSNTSNPDYQIVEVNGRKAFYGLSREGANAHLSLGWIDGQLNYLMFYFEEMAANGGSTLSKEKMIAIAESMSELNEFRGRTSAFKPYAYVAAYEQSLGFDMKEFPATPTGWSYANVSAYAQPDSIIVTYTGEKEGGSLSLTQSLTTTEVFDRYDIPSKAIESVSIGKSKGKYIRGTAEFDENGKMVWNSNLPFHTLIWQEGEFRMQLTVTGDSALLYDKDDLISYAESLR